MKRKRTEEDDRVDPRKEKKLKLDHLTLEDLPTNLRKYWYSRYLRFSKFDEGIHTDADGLCESSFEEIARHVSKRVSSSFKKKIIVLDAFSGCGVSGIQFALNPNIRKVIFVDIDPKKIEMARHNCSVYGVDPKKTEFIVSDIFDSQKELNNQEIDICFLSPPWGGPSYKDQEMYSLKNHVSFKDGTENGISLFNFVYSNITKNICYSLPLNLDQTELHEFEYSGKIEIETNYFNNKPKTKTLYFGNLVRKKK